MSALLSVVVYLVVIGLLWWCTTLLPLPAPIPTIIMVVFVIIAICAFLSLLGVYPLGMPRLRV